MNEAETRAELIDPALKAAGWGVVEAGRVRREVITLGRLLGAGVRTAQDIAIPASLIAALVVGPARNSSTKVITLVHQQGANRPSGHIHTPAFIRYPTRNIPGFIEDVSDHRRRPGEPSEPIAMQLDPANP